VIRRLERLPDFLLSIAAIGIAITFAHREFSSGPKPVRPTQPRFVRDWVQLLPLGEVIGNPNAPIKVVEFGDFECPFCKAEDSVYRQVTRAGGSNVALFFVHFPLKFHHFAMPAARASECAALQGRFSPFHDLIYALQDSLGLKSWGSYAHDAGVADTVGFERCIGGSQQFSRIEAGIEAAKRFDVHATPTVLVNGWEFPIPPNAEELDSAISSFSSRVHR